MTQRRSKQRREQCSAWEHFHPPYLAIKYIITKTNTVNQMGFKYIFKGTKHWKAAHTYTHSHPPTHTLTLKKNKKSRLNVCVFEFYGTYERPRESIFISPARSCLQRWPVLMYTCHFNRTLTVVAADWHSHDESEEDRNEEERLPPDRLHLSCRLSDEASS